MSSSTFKGSFVTGKSFSQEAFENKNHKLSCGLTLTPEGMQAFEKSQLKQLLQTCENTLINLYKSLYNEEAGNCVAVQQSDNEYFESGTSDIHCNNKIVYHIDYSIESGKLKMEIKII